MNDLFDSTYTKRVSVLVRRYWVAVLTLIWISLGVCKLYSDYLQRLAVARIVTSPTCSSLRFVGFDANYENGLCKLKMSKKDKMLCYKEVIRDNESLIHRDPDLWARFWFSKPVLMLYPNSRLSEGSFFLLERDGKIFAYHIPLFMDHTPLSVDLSLTKNESPSCVFSDSGEPFLVVPSNK